MHGQNHIKFTCVLFAGVIKRASNYTKQSLCW